LILSGVGALDAQGDGVWLIGSLPHDGFEGMAALSFWTPWPLIQICCEKSLFRDLLAGLSTGLTCNNRGAGVTDRPLVWVGINVGKTAHHACVMDTDGEMQVIIAHVPQAELFAYATELRSLAQGRGSFTATLDHYDDVPGHIAEKVMDAHRKELEAAGGHAPGH